MYPSAGGVFAHRPPDDCWTEQRDHKTYRVQLGDTGDSEALPLTLDHPEPVRVVRSQEVLERNGYRQGELTPQPTDQEWLGITRLPAQAFPAPVIRRLGHDRWKQENHGWMDLTPHGAFQQGFLHACRHHPKRRHAAGQRERVPNQGLAAVTLILLIAFTLGSAFVRRHSKLVRRHHLTALAVAAQLHRCISKAPPSVRAPT